MKYVDYTIQNKIAYITLNRPEKRNALNQELVGELKEVFKNAEADSDVKIIVLKGKGEAFCAGADLGYLQQLQNFSYEENLQDSNHLKELFHRIYSLPKIVIAQVEGHALAGGCGLVTVCDFAFSVPEAKFGYTEVKIGFVPAIVMVFLLRKIGEMKAKHLLLTGDVISANDAKGFNLITEVVAEERIQDHVNAFAQKLITTNSSQAMTLTKNLISQVQGLSLHDALKHAAEANAKARASEDCRRGIAAFVNKEKISW